MKRQMLKVQYQKFCQAWQDEKTYQRVREESGVKLPEGVQSLGRKPTFAMWLRAMENKKLAEQQVKPEKAVEVQDTSWEE